MGCRLTPLVPDFNPPGPGLVRGKRTRVLVAPSSDAPVAGGGPRLSPVPPRSQSRSASKECAMPRTRKQARMEEEEQKATAAKAAKSAQAAVLSRILMDPAHEDLCHIIMKILFEVEKTRLHVGRKCLCHHRPVTMLMITSMQMVVSNISLIMINTMQRYSHRRYQEYQQVFLARPYPRGREDQILTLTLTLRLKIYEWAIAHGKAREIALAKWRKIKEMKKLTEENGEINMMREEIKKLTEENGKINMMREEIKKLREENEKLRARS